MVVLLGWVGLGWAGSFLDDVCAQNRFGVEEGRREKVASDRRLPTATNKHRNKCVPEHDAFNFCGRYRVVGVGAHFLPAICFCLPATT